MNLTESDRELFDDLAYDHKGEMIMSLLYTISNSEIVIEQLSNHHWRLTRTFDSNVDCVDQVYLDTKETIMKTFETIMELEVERQYEIQTAYH